MVRKVNKAMCQAAFYEMMAAGIPYLTALSDDHQLTMQLCRNMLADFWTSSPPTEPESTATVVTISPEEADTAQ